MIKVLLTTTLLAALSSCSKDKSTEHPTVLQSIYNTYKNGSIEECRLNGNLVYTAGDNAYDAGATIFDSLGNVIGTCNFAWGPVDTICKQVKSCQVIYRCNNYITGEPFIDKYGLSK